MDGIIPAAGLAIRMRGLPKFLLPCSLEYQTLLERHVEKMLDFCDTIWIPTRPDLVAILHSLGISSERVVVLPLSTKTMTETTFRILSLSKSSEFMLCMPDTFFLGELPYAELANLQSDAKLACWKIRQEQRGKLGQIKFEDSMRNQGRILEERDKDPECNFEFIWGAMSFNREFASLGDSEMPHVGFLINPAIRGSLDVTGFVLGGQYYDCGTPTEYLNLINEISNA